MHECNYTNIFKSIMNLTIHWRWTHTPLERIRRAALNSSEMLGEGLLEVENKSRIV